MVLTDEQSRFLDEVSAEMFDADFMAWCDAMELEYGNADHPVLCGVAFYQVVLSK